MNSLYFSSFTSILKMFPKVQSFTLSLRRKQSCTLFSLKEESLTREGTCWLKQSLGTHSILTFCSFMNEEMDAFKEVDIDGGGKHSCASDHCLTAVARVGKTSK